MKVYLAPSGVLLLSGMLSLVSSFLDLKVCATSAVKLKLRRNYFRVMQDFIQLTIYYPNYLLYFPFSLVHVEVIICT